MAGSDYFITPVTAFKLTGYNYLVPVDADIPQEDEVKYAAVPMNFVLDKMQTANNSLNIVILDACRNNPFARSWRNYRDIGDSGGLARVTPPQGTLVIYATRPGDVASDGKGRNGLFTASLLKQIKKPNLELDPMIKALILDVAQTSGNKQYPWREGTFTGDFYFAKSAYPATVKPDTQAKVENVVEKDKAAVEREAWGYVKDSTNAQDFRDFLKEFPAGANANNAKVKLEQTVWDSVKDSKDKAKIQVYLDDFQTGANAPVARMRLKQLYASEKVAEVKPSLDKANQTANYNRWVSMLYQVKYQELISEIDLELRANPSNALALRMKASALTFFAPKTGILKIDSREIIHILENPSNSEEYESRCFAQIQIGDNYAAVVDCRKALELNPKLGLAFLNLGIAYTNIARDGRGCSDLGIDIFTEAIKLNPQDYLAYFERGKAYDCKNNTAKAFSDYSKIIEINPRFADAYWQRSQFGEDFDRRIADLTRFIELSGADWMALEDRGALYLEQRKYDLAIADFTKSIAVEENVPSLQLRADAYDAIGKPNLATADRKRMQERLAKPWTTGVKSKSQPQTQPKTSQPQTQPKIICDADPTAKCADVRQKDGTIVRMRIN